MEAAQISRGLWYILKGKAPFSDPEKLLPPIHLLEAICLAHDLGHPPFGHTGETALNLAMRHHGGFEGNGQTLRLLARLEAHTPKFGLNPTRRTLLGVLKYPVPYSQLKPLAQSPDTLDRFSIRWDDWKPPKCYLDDEQEVIAWVLEPFPEDERKRFCEFKASSDANKPSKPKYQSLDTSIMTLADDIAFGIHDLEDASALGLIEADDLPPSSKWDSSSEWAKEFEVERALQSLFSRDHHKRKQSAGALVNAFIQAAEWQELPEFQSDLLHYNARLLPAADDLLKLLKDLEFSKVVTSYKVQTLEYRGGHLVLELFRAIAAAPDRLLPESFRSDFKATQDKSHQMRVICDYVSGMTDEFATKQYERLFIPRRGSSLSPV